MKAQIVNVILGSNQQSIISCISCHLYRAHRSILLDEVSDIVGNDISQLPDDHLCDLLLYGSKAYNEKANEMILKCTVKFVKLTKRFQ